MAANAGTLLAVGKSGRTYSFDLYVPDAAATYVGFNKSGLASTASPTTYTADEDMTVVDISIAAVPSALGAVFQIGQGSQNGTTLRWANQLAANPNRPKFRIGIPGGAQVSMLQF